MKNKMASLRNNNHPDSIPVATALAVEEDENCLNQEPLLRNQRTDDEQNKGKGGKSSTPSAYESQFQLSTGGGSQPTYWGRFNDSNAEVLATNTQDYGDDHHIPVATARPDDRLVRLRFIRKVYTILSAQLAVTFAMCAFMSLYEPMRTFALGNGMALYMFNMVVTFASICALHVYKRQYPTNYYILSIFTISMSYSLGTITAMYSAAGAGELVTEAVFITATVFVALTIFTLQSKWDFSFMGAGLGVCLWIMLLWGFFSSLFGMRTGSVYALFGSVLFSLYIIYDTYLIAERLDPEDYIVAAIELYLDLVNLFLYILQLLSSRRD